MNDNVEKKTILACFPHADDEISCVGTMANHASRGDRVVLCFATYGEMTTLMGEVTHEEIVAAREKHAETVAKIIGCEFMFLLTWNIYHRHPDHRSLAQLVIDGVQLARISHVVEPKKPHRKDVIIYQYYDERVLLPSVYVDVSDSIDKIKEVTQCYADTYNWKRAVESVLARRRSMGLDCDVEYAERFTVLRRRNKPVKFII
jgi:LmbE family N-acetylglucosaminyl deacetylase